MSSLVERLEPPSSDNKYYIKNNAPYNGYNRCMVIDIRTGSVLPNCVGYAWGRFCESQEIHNCNLSTGNASGWWAHNDSYERGQTPKTGAVICFGGGDGHVAFVEEVRSNGDVLTSNSAYGGRRFYTKVYKAADNYYLGSKYHFQGFIYNPIDFDTSTLTGVYKSKFPWVLYARKIRKRNK